MNEYICNMDFNFFCQNAYEFDKDCIVDCSVLTSEHLKGMDTLSGEITFSASQNTTSAFYSFFLKGKYILFLEPTRCEKALFGFSLI